MGKTLTQDGFCVYEGFWWKLALPAVVLPAHFGVFLASCIWAATRVDGDWGVLLSGVALGLFVWTLFEYVFHRWLLHHYRIPFLSKIFWKALHKEHHMARYMKDPDHHAIHLAISLPVVLLPFLLIGFETESAWGLAIFGGWLLGYIAYELLHWAFHTATEKDFVMHWKPLRRLWQAHTTHHLQAANKNYGFVTMIWDKALGTYSAKREEVRAREFSIS